MGLVEEHVRLTNSIVAGDLTVEQVKEELNRIETEYGPDSFDLYKVKKKSAPWSKEDLEDLEIQSASGACSKDFYLYMAEVSEFVHRKNRKSGLLGFVDSLVRFIAKHWLIILIIFGLCIVATLIFIKLAG